MPRVLRYSLTQQCGASRPLCFDCETSFTILTGDAIECPSAPAPVICLKPVRGGLIQADCGRIDCGATMPESWQIVIEWPDLSEYDTFSIPLINLGAGRIEAIVNSVVVEPTEPGVFFGTPGMCGIELYFSLASFPYYDMGNSYNDNRPTGNYYLWVNMSNGFHHGVRLVGIDPSVPSGHVSLPTSFYGEPQDIQDPSGTPAFCVNHNQQGVFPHIPIDSLFGSPADFPQLPITITITPVVDGA